MNLFSDKHQILFICIFIQLSLIYTSKYLHDIYDNNIKQKECGYVMSTNIQDYNKSYDVSININGTLKYAKVLNQSNPPSINDFYCIKHTYNGIDFTLKVLSTLIGIIGIVMSFVLFGVVFENNSVFDNMNDKGNR